MTMRFPMAAVSLLLVAPLFPGSGAASAQTTMSIGASGANARAAGEAIRIVAFENEVIAPRDAASGLPTGKRQHKPLTVTKPIDKASPMLYNALLTGETIPSIELAAGNPAARSGGYLKIRLENVKVAGITARSGGAGASDDRLPMEEIALSYGKITWTWADGTEYTDNREAARSGQAAPVGGAVRR